MSIQTFAYQLAQKIQKEHGIKISRSHIYELIALNQGYRSYNSFVAQNLLLDCEYDVSEEYHEHELLNLLTLDILKNPPKTDYANYDDDAIHWDNYESRELLEKIKIFIERVQLLLKQKISEEMYFHIAKLVVRELLSLSLSYLNFSYFRQRIAFLSFQNGLIDPDSLDDEIYSFENADSSSTTSFIDIEENLEQIEDYAKERNNLDAYAVLASYYRYLANQIAPYGRQGSTFGSTWDNQKQKYVKSQKTTDNIKQYEELIKLANFYEEFIKFAPANIAEIDMDADGETVYKQFLYLCNRGDLDAIETFLYQKIFKNSGEAWVYIYLAQLLNTDFTKDDFRAYNAYTGEEYDDYGPMEIAGREAIQYAIHLEQLNDEKDQLARKIAQDLFEKI